MIISLLVFCGALFLVIQGATLATRYSARLAESFRLARYVVGFIIVAFISILPETLISINSALAEVPEFGLGVLFGSNIADLTLVFAILILVAGRGIKVKSRILENIRFYPLFLFLPLAFGLNGHYARLEGALLIIAGLLFYYLILKRGVRAAAEGGRQSRKYRYLLGLMLAMVLLLVGAHFTVTAAITLADFFGVSSILIGMFIVGLGATLPELFYSFKALKAKDDDLAIGDILGTVLADATIVVGVLAFIKPFYFPAKIVYITGAFMLAGSLVLLRFMRSGRAITRREGYWLLAFWFFYILMELATAGL